ncbi:MAG TPA: GDSL-type esterase/lipase family protein, partial [Candidatus Methylomirabilis sp.]|nr:GDSL-type esterase/lipase family protein [Candidatus Methylomirabilis sp.]
MNKEPSMMMSSVVPEIPREGRGVRTEQRWVRPLLAYAIFCAIACLLIQITSGVFLYIFATVAAVTFVFVIREAGVLLAQACGRRMAFSGLNRLALVVGGLMGSLVLLEAGLHLLSLFTTVPRWAPRIRTDLVMPEAWKLKREHIEGAVSAYYWHGHLHVHNHDDMRLIGDFPPKRPGIFRIMVVGDSLTFGTGIAQEDTYSAVLERYLGERFRVEVLNLGVEGAQSEDVYRILREKLPILSPDLVVYGMCLNDFLPSGVPQYETTPRLTLPVPFKHRFRRHTLLGFLLDRKYDALLIRLGIRDDFLGDILRDLSGYQVRFARDVKAMNDLVLRAGLPPLVAMVLDQYLDPDGKGSAVGQVAEKLMAAGGIQVV